MKPVFILGYNAQDYFCQWFDRNNYSEEYKFYFIDNGSQNLNEKIKSDFEVYVTSKNIGCSGGWNLICNIAFNTLGFDKVIIGEEDALFSNDILDELWRVSNHETLATTYNNGFGYALFCMHKEIFSSVGMFDENIMYAGCEDNDYDHRCKLMNVNNYNLGISSQYNGSATSYDINSPRQSVGKHNADYVENKWGKNYEYTKPFNGQPFSFDPLLLQHYGELTEFPSQTEYKIYKSK
jgi:hypothetical protein